MAWLGVDAERPFAQKTAPASNGFEQAGLQRTGQRICRNLAASQASSIMRMSS